MSFTIRRDGMCAVEMVYYSLASGGGPKYERQWTQSVRSLRSYNRAVEVHLFLYGSATRSILREVGRQAVVLHQTADYSSCLRELMPVAHAAALAHYPVLHKVLSLRRLPSGKSSRVLYLDCDTFFFGDVAALFDKCRTHDFYAREEPWSRRSHYGYRANYLDEGQLQRTALAQGLAYVPPYNAGVYMMNHGLAHRLAAASRQYLGFAWRLLTTLCTESPLREAVSPELADAVRRALRRPDVRSRLAYPSGNWWIVEQIAMS